MAITTTKTTTKDFLCLKKTFFVEGNFILLDFFNIDFNLDKSTISTGIAPIIIKVIP